MKYLDSQKLKDIVKHDNRFILADINLRDGTIGFQSIWHGFGSKGEIRGPRFMELPPAEYLEIVEKIGYDMIIFDKESELEWLDKGTGKGLFHISFIEKNFPSILKPSPSVNSDKYGGFFDKKSEFGMYLSRKRLSKKERQKLFEEFGGKCCLCNSTENLTVHHIKARQFGGGTERLNSVLICQECHAKINNKEIDGLSLHTLRYREGSFMSRYGVNKENPKNSDEQSLSDS